MKKIYILILLIGFSEIWAQDTISFYECIESAVQFAPRSADTRLVREEGDLAVKNVKSGWYPALDINGKASYQSDVVSLQIEQPGLMIDFPEMPHEQYGINLDVKQMIYDGGFSKEKMKYEQLQTAVAIEEIEKDIFALKQKVAGAYFSLLLLEENRRILEVALRNLKSREQPILSAIENGAARDVDLQTIRVEILQVLQSLSEIDASKNSVIDLLQVYTGLEIEMEDIFEIPYLELQSEVDITRPEQQLFQLQQALMESSSSLLGVKRKPVLYAFGQAGAGMPGYNMLNSEFNTYFMVGAGLSWKIWDWNKVNREQQIIETRRQMIKHGEETFSQALEVGLQKELNRLEHLNDAIALDKKMLGMRISITKVAASELDHGVINASGYIRVLNEEVLTRVKQTRHEVELMQAICNYNLFKGSL